MSEFRTLRVHKTKRFAAFLAFFMVGSGPYGCGGELLRYRTKMWKQCQEDLEKQKETHDRVKEDHKAELQKAGRERSLLAADLNNLKDELLKRDHRIDALEQRAKSDAEQIEELNRQKAQAQERSDLFKAIALSLKEMIEAGDLQVEIRKGRMIVKMSDQVLFDPGRAELKRGAREPLRKLAEVLKDIPDRDFVVAGHTDNKRLRSGGRFKTNWELSTARSVEVVKFLQKEGVAAERLSAAGYSEFDPIGDNTTEKGRALNRRIEIVVMPKISELPSIQIEEDPDSDSAETEEATEKIRPEEIPPGGHDDHEDSAEQERENDQESSRKEATNSKGRKRTKDKTTK